MNATDIFKSLGELGFSPVTALLLAAIVVYGVWLWKQIQSAPAKYFEKKAENFAQKQDLKELTEIVKEVESRFTERIEKYKAELEQKKLVSRIQFEKEFQIYIELWKKLFDVGRATLQLRPIYESVQADKTNDEIKLEKWRKFADAFNAFRDEMEYNKPFYDKVVYDKLSRLRELVHLESTYFRHDRPGEDFQRYWDTALKNRDAITSIIDEACESIRARIQGLEVANNSSLNQ